MGVEVDPKKFKASIEGAVFNAGVRAIALKFCVNPSTVERWISGVSIPHPDIVENILKELEKL